MRKNPLQAALFVGLLAVFVYFYGYVPLWSGGTQSTSSWAWSAWNPEGNQEHGKLVVPAVLFLVGYHRNQLAAAPKEGSNWGLLFVAAGVLAFVVAARTVQARLAIVALPLLVFGAIYYLWGGRVARILLFPCALLIFAVPFGALEQATFQLQFTITGIVGALSHLFGIKIQAVGTTLSAAVVSAADKPWNFDIAEGCSGIRSLMAMTMITALVCASHAGQTLEKASDFLRVRRFCDYRKRRSDLYHCPGSEILGPEDRIGDVSRLFGIHLLSDRAGGDARIRGTGELAAQGPTSGDENQSGRAGPKHCPPAHSKWDIEG